MSAVAVALRGAATIAAVGAGGYVAGQALARQSGAKQIPETKTTEEVRAPQSQLSSQAASDAKSSQPPSDPRLAFWHERWEKGLLGWHLEKPHPVLQKHLNELLGDNGETQRMVLFPLCGASVDLGSLARRGHHVVGVEAVPSAIDRLLKEWGEEVKGGTPPNDGTLWLRVGQPSWFQRIVAEQLGKAEGRAYQPAPFLFAVQGDFLRFDSAAAGKWGFTGFDCAFDRGGLVAVPPNDRKRYAEILTDQVSPGGKLLLVVVEHDPAFGPPHSINEAEVKALLAPGFDIRKLSCTDQLVAEPHWKERGATRFDEVAYLCTRKIK